VSRPYRIDEHGRLRFVAQRRRTDSPPTERSDLAGILVWALVGLACWLIVIAAGNAYVAHRGNQRAAEKLSACLEMAARLGIPQDQCR
jgi:hypothetical protein